MFFGKKDETVVSPDLTLPLLPLRDIVVFPYMVSPLFVGRDRSIKAVETAIKTEKLIFLASQRNAQQTNPESTDIFSIGVVGQIIQLLKLPDNTIKIFVEGRYRAQIRRFIEQDPYFMVEISPIDDEISGREIELQALVRGLRNVSESYVAADNKAPQDFLNAIKSINEPGRLADTIAGQISLRLEDKQALLEKVSVRQRIERLLELMQSEIEISEIEKTIRERVKKQMEKTQKEYYLNEQMRAIQKEMGEKDEFKSEIAEIEEQLQQKELTVEAELRVRKEIRKLKMMAPMSAEATVVRNYIDWFLVLPWSEISKTELHIDEAQKILDEDHYGLKEVKERIIEYLSVQKLAPDIKGPILCLVGPPGVGKTSLARSVARATGREFVRISLGGVRDEAEIRGHRRTYIGALPGKIVQSMKKCETINPVMLLDEVDKMSTDFRGDPSAALLEVLDPEQNHAFNDHYLDVDYDLSKVMFITTANTLHGIPAPLQDRMEIIRLPGYTDFEKLRIAERFLVPKQTKSNGLTSSHITFSRKAIIRMARRYTREAGVRELERQIAKVCRKVARKVVDGSIANGIDICPRDIGSFLGAPKFRYGAREQSLKTGIANGLAWTEVGGELLTVEVALMPGSGKFTVTGKLGEVMQESAQAAMSYVRSRALSLGLKPDFYDKIDIHIHVPEGATPKDGPSAGITMTTAILSALTKQPFPNDLAMTGEITLRGRILPIGGLKEKLLAAKRGLLSRIIIPRENERDLTEVPKKIRSGLNIILVDHMDEALRVVFPEIQDAFIPSEQVTEQSLSVLKQ
ncbi:MAG: endopeptidase La [Deltaproteobacteria bacterium]|nr:endopeptidase La [Deltaproteobacteria bacterium]